MSAESWEIKGVNYWENDDCPRNYLENALIDLLMFVEGVEVIAEQFSNMSDDELRREVGFYEYVSDK